MVLRNSLKRSSLPPKKKKKLKEGKLEMASVLVVPRAHLVIYLQLIYYIFVVGGALQFSYYIIAHT